MKMSEALYPVDVNDREMCGYCGSPHHATIHRAPEECDECWDHDEHHIFITEEDYGKLIDQAVAKEDGVLEGGDTQERG